MEQGELQQAIAVMKAAEPKPEPAIILPSQTQGNHVERTAQAKVAVPDAPAIVHSIEAPAMSGQRDGPGTK